MAKSMYTSHSLTVILYVLVKHAISNLLAAVVASTLVECLSTGLYSVGFSAHYTREHRWDQTQILDKVRWLRSGLCADHLVLPLQPCKPHVHGHKQVLAPWFYYRGNLKNTACKDIVDNYGLQFCGISLEWALVHELQVRCSHTFGHIAYIFSL